MSICFALLISLNFIYAHAFAEGPWVSETEAEVHYKRQLPIYLQHDLGDISIQGWNQDLIRVKLKKTVTSESEAAASEIFKKFELVSLETPQAVELRVGTPLGTDILTKLRSRQLKKNIRVDLEIKAPIAMALTLLAGEDRRIKLSQWRGKLNITGKKGAVELSKIRSAQPLTLNCPDCPISINDSEVFGSILSGNSPIELKKVSAIPKPLLVFSQNGDISLFQTRGTFQVRSVNGSVISAVHQGPLYLQTDLGKLSMEDLEGDLDAQTVSGNIHLVSKRVSKLIQLKSRSGGIDISLPWDFSGDVDLQSIQGEAKSDFRIQKNPDAKTETYGPEVKGKLVGKIGEDGKASVFAFTESGSILVSRKGMKP